MLVLNGAALSLNVQLMLYWTLLLLRDLMCLLSVVVFPTLCFMWALCLSLNPTVQPVYDSVELVSSLVTWYLYTILLFMHWSGIGHSALILQLQWGTSLSASSLCEKFCCGFCCCKFCFKMIFRPCYLYFFIFFKMIFRPCYFYFFPHFASGVGGFWKVCKILLLYNSWVICFSDLFISIITKWNLTKLKSIVLKRIIKKV